MPGQWRPTLADLTQAQMYTLNAADSIRAQMVTLQTRVNEPCAEWMGKGTGDDRARRDSSMERMTT